MTSNPDSTLLLTACVNPNGMSQTRLQNPQERLKQYVDALKWYLENTSMRVVVVENTLTDYSADFSDYIGNGRLEFITFDGNSYDRSLGKGYGEALIIKEGLERSQILRQGGNIIKVTGRLVVNNINELARGFSAPDTVSSNTELSGGRYLSYSMVFAAPREFFADYFLRDISALNDSAGYFFEHLLFERIAEWKRDGHLHKEISIPVKIEGISGSTGMPYRNPSWLEGIKAAIKSFLHSHNIYINHPQQ